MRESLSQKLPPAPRLFRQIGIALFALSFLAPARWSDGVDLHLFGGCAAFVETPVDALDLIATTGDAAWVNGVLKGIVAMAAWLTNFTVFFRLPQATALVAITLPWIAYVCFFFILAGFIPFYFWALGIALIHGSRLLQVRQDFHKLNGPVSSP